jgi:predicted AlkP superfamily phosphohydrolase/phosphomutase/Flp pilus assembly protein TadD
MKRIRFLLIAILSVLILAGVAGMRRISSGEQAVRVGRDGSVAQVNAGWRFVGPGTELIRYPVGEWSARVPASGTHAVTFSGGDTLGVAFEFTMRIPENSAAALYRGFSKEFAPAFDKLVAAAAEIEAAALPATAAGDLHAAVEDRVREEMGRFGIEVRAGDGTAGAPPAPRRLIIVGVDGGDWLNLRPLMDAGRLPNFSRLVREGATGPLRSEEPMLSPLLWTTMATGRLPEQHGILNFTVVDPETGERAPVSRLQRKVDAFWNILGDYHRSVGIIGWLATDPAEKVDGVMVTDKFGYLAFIPENKRRGESTSVYPPARLPEFEALVVHADEVRDEEVQRFVHVTPGELARHRRTTDNNDPVHHLLHMYASTLTYRNIAIHLLENDRPDVLAVYFEWVDAVSHLFMLHSPPRMADIPQDEYDRYRDAIDEAYMLQDEILGSIMSRMDDRTVLMVLSDHGWKSGPARLRNRPEIWAGNAALWHRADGIVGFLGAGVKPGAAIAGASIRDVTPTILALMGLPQAADMAGRPMRGAFTEEVTKSFRDERVATLDRPREDAAARTKSADRETMQKLEALGYLAPDNPDALHNLGQRYQQQGDFRRAIEQYRKAIEMRPTFYNAYNNLATCYGQLKMYPEAIDALERCIALKPDDYFAMSNLAVVMIHTGRPDEALRFAEQAVRTEPAYANGRVTLGTVLAMNRRYDEAEKQFNEALRLDPGNSEARENLAKVKAARGQ